MTLEDEQQFAISLAVTELMTAQNELQSTLRLVEGMEVSLLASLGELSNEQAAARLDNLRGMLYRLDELLQEANLAEHLKDLEGVKWVQVGKQGQGAQ